MYYTSNFSTWYPSISTAVCQWETRILSLHCTSLNFLLAATSSIILSSLPNLLSRYPLGLQRDRNLREQDLGWMVGGEEQSIQKLWLLPIYLNLCVVMRCIEEDFQQHFLWGWILLKCFYNVLSVWMYRSDFNVLLTMHFSDD